MGGYRWIFSLLLLSIPSFGGADVTRLQPVVDSKLAGGGCYISFVQPKSVAEQAGIRVGDVVIQAGGKPIGTITDLHNAVTQAQGDFALHVQRGDKTETLKAYIDAQKTGPKLGVRCIPMPSAPFTFYSSSYTITAQASMVQDLTFVRVRILNNSKHPLSVSPHLFSVADGTRVMLKLLEPTEVTTILQSALERDSTPPPAGQTLGSYLFGSVGMSLTEAPMPPYMPPAITPALVAKEALEPSELEPGYSVEGIVFFNGAKNLPLTLMAKIDGENSTAVFNTESFIAAETPAVPVPAAVPVLTAEISSEPFHPAEEDLLNCPSAYHQKVKLTLNDGKIVTGRLASCASQKVSLRNGLLYRTFDAGRVVKIEVMP